MPTKGVSALRAAKRAPLAGETVRLDLSADVLVGCIPEGEGHAHEGKWAIIVQLYPFDTPEAAQAMADRIGPQLKQRIVALWPTQ